MSHIMARFTSLHVATWTKIKVMNNMCKKSKALKSTHYFLLNNINIRPAKETQSNIKIRVHLLVYSNPKQYSNPNQSAHPSLINRMFQKPSSQFSRLLIHYLASFQLQPLKCITSISYP